MITRVRIEAEGSTPDEVLHQMETARQALVNSANGDTALDVMFGISSTDGGRPGLRDATMGDCHLERRARSNSGPGVDGQVFFRGRMVAHFARPSDSSGLKGHSELPSGGATEPAPAKQGERMSLNGEDSYTITKGGVTFPKFGVPTDAELTAGKLITAAHHHRLARPLRVFVAPGDTYVAALRLWMQDEMVNQLYDQPEEHPNLSPHHWQLGTPSDG